MLHSPLFEKIRNYLLTAKDDEQIFLFVPFIKVNILEKLLDDISNKVIIITDWSPQNLIDGSSELNLYPFCKQRGFTLYHNEKIHLKVFSIAFNDLILSTGNISNRGLMPNGSKEMAELIKQITNEDRLYLEQIRKDASRINDEIFEQLEKWQQENPPKLKSQEEFSEITEPLKRDEFLIAELPMTKDVDTLVECYKKMNLGQKIHQDKEISDCAYHDIANYEINLGLTKEEFFNQLKKQFFAHKFIQRIDEFIPTNKYVKENPNERHHFGLLKEWVRNNCHDVPIPSRRDLKGNIQVLQEWFVKLGDGKYVKDVPGGHSERLTKIEGFEK